MLGSTRQLLTQETCQAITIRFLKVFTVLKILWAYNIEKLSSKKYSPQNALTKLLIEKGLITQDEFMQKLSDERAVYQAMLQKMG